MLRQAENLGGIKQCRCDLRCLLQDIGREKLEIYGLYASGKYQNTRKVYQQIYSQAGGTGGRFYLGPHRGGPAGDGPDTVR